MGFVSFMKAVGHDIKKGLDFILPYAETMGETAVSLLAPSLGPLFNQTVAAVVTAEQAAVAAGQQKTGTQKLAAVVALMGPLIKQALTDAGKPNNDTDIQNWINAVVTILNVAPAPSTNTEAVAK